MKRLYPILAAATLLAACSSSSGGSSGSTSTGSTTTTGSSSATTSSSTSSTGTNGVTSGGSTGISNGSGSTGQSTTTASSSSSGSSGTTSANGSGSGSGGSTGGPPPANDLCANAIALTVHAPGDTQTVTGDTSNGNSDFDSSCGGAGADVYYALHLTADSEVVVTMTESDPARTAVPSIVQDCSATTELVCSTSTSSTPAVVTDYNLAAGDYIIVADNFSGDDGPFTLTVTLSTPPPPPANDTCAGTLTAIPEGASGLTGQTFAQASNDYSPSSASTNCTGYTAQGPDLVYTFSPSQTGTYAIDMTRTAGTADLSLYVLDTCPPAGSADGGANITQCLGGSDHSGSTPEHVVLSLNQGTTYYVIADNYSHTSDATFTLTAQPYVIPPGDTCSGLESDGGTTLALADPGDGGLLGSLEFSTVGFTDDTSSDFNGQCFGDGSGPDRVFQLVLPAAVPSLTATVTPYPDAGSFEPLVYIRESPCADNGFGDGGAPAELTCGEAATGGESATATASSVSAGTYFIWVDGYAGSAGPGTLSVSVP